MNDLRNGIIDINGFLVGPDTALEEIEAHFGMAARREPNCADYAFFDLGGNTFVSNGIEFKVDMSFTNSKLDDIILYPVLPDIAAKHNLRGTREELLSYYQELRFILDIWLEKQMGAPSYKNSEVTEYKFQQILIGTDSYIDLRDRDHRVVGGTIDVYFR